MTAPRFVSELPAVVAGRRPDGVFDALRGNPGEWAEIGRYPLWRRNDAYNRAQYVRRTYPDLEATCRTIGDDVLVFARAVVQ